MAKEKIRLDSEVEKLVNRYRDLNGLKLDDLINKALRFYIVHQLGSKEVRAALRAKDNNSAQIIDKLLRNNFHNNLNDY